MEADLSMKNDHGVAGGSSSLLSAHIIAKFFFSSPPRYATAPDDDDGMIGAAQLTREAEGLYLSSSRTVRGKVGKDAVKYFKKQFGK